MQIEATGKSVELAIQNGLLECGLRREDVQVKVLDAGGLFKKAKVLLTWGEETTEPNSVIETEQKSLKFENDKMDVTIYNTEDDSSNEVEFEEKEKKKRIINTARLEKRGIEFLLGLVRKIDENATVEAQSGENEISFSIKGEKVGVLEMRRHLSNYFKGLPDFKATRLKLVTENDIPVLLDTLDYIGERWGDFDTSGITPPPLSNDI